MKTCTGCREAKPLDQFNRHSRQPSGYQSRCRECTRADQRQQYQALPAGLNAERHARFVSNNRDLANEYQRRWYENHRDEIRDTRLMRDFGIDVTEYDEMLERQGGGCAICGGSCPSGRRLAVDHDHETGAVRGLLCGPCNMALGLLERRGVPLAAFAAYLSVTTTA